MNESNVPEQAPQGGVIEAQSAAVARAMASICNDAHGVRGMSGHERFVHTFSGPWRRATRADDEHQAGYETRRAEGAAPGQVMALEIGLSER